MLAWTPPKGTTVHILLRPSREAPPREKPKPRGLLGSLANRLRTSPAPTMPDRPTVLSRIKQLGRDHNLPQIGDNGVTLDLDDARLPPLMDALEAAGSQGIELASCFLTEPPPPRSADRWYLMKPCARRFFSPSGMRPSQHFATLHEARLLASETLIRVVEEANLTGLDWLPLPDMPDRDPLTWYQVFGTHFLGRGLDHPMFNRARRDTEYATDSLTSPMRCIGEPLVSHSNVRPDVRLAPAHLERLRGLSSESAFRVEGTQRLIREFLPPADFAYRGDSYGIETKRPEFGRRRDLYCCHRARESLLNARVMRPSDFIPIPVVSECEADVEVLDRRPLPLPPPTFTPEEAAAERARREAIKLSAPAPRASLRLASWLEAEQYLTMRLNDGTATWEPMSPESAKEALADPAARACPKAWRMLLPLIPESVDEQNSDGIEFECGIPHDDMHHEQNEESDPDGPLKGDIVIAWSPNGDWFAIRPSDPAMPEEAGVTWWDHETLRAHHEWPSICAFVAKLIETADRVAN